MTLRDKIKEFAKEFGQGQLFTSASEESLDLQWNDDFGQENELDGYAWDDVNIYDVTCYDGVNGLHVIAKAPLGGRPLK